MDPVYLLAHLLELLYGRNDGDVVKLPKVSAGQ